MESLSQIEKEGLREMRNLNAEFLKEGKGTDEVLKYLKNAQSDDQLLLWFLRGRKYKAQHAWETLKRNAEVRCDVYPELFPVKISEKVVTLLCDSQAIGFLKKRDKFGRRVAMVDIGKWDPDIYSVDDFDTAMATMAQKSSTDKDAMENGVILIQQFIGMDRRRAQEFRLRSIRRVSDVFLHSFPLKVKGVFFVNVPYLFSYLINLIKMFFPKKLKQRLFVTSSDLPDCKELTELVSLEDLPMSFGGKLDFYEAVEDPRPYLQ